VALYQDSTFFYCDSAIVFNNTVRANGNIQILQGDSTRVFADSLFYSGDDRKADLKGEVSLYHLENNLFTDVLSYDLGEKKASYVEKAVLTRGSTKITSVRGTYFLDDHLAVFADSVIVVDTNFVLKADTLNFNTKDKIAYFQGPTSIEREENSMYCEDGYYNMKTGEAEFIDKATFIKGDQRGRADRFIYEDSAGIITLIGNARIIEGKQEVRGDSIVYFQKDEKGEIHGNGYFKDQTRMIQGTSIYFSEKDKSLRTGGDAVFSEGDIVLNAESLVYDDLTGDGRAEGNVVWQDTVNDVAIYSDILNTTRPAVM
jgi:lipopolysaccharide transport protein LptA